ncbi:MAG TPA: thiolase domain-containing protein [Acidimicrobiia bacterium]|nr:thiolase domain-containing protein [Acidimicrobiia bacterium]
MRSVAVVGFAQAPNVRRTTGTANGVEMLVPIAHELYAQTGLEKRDIGFFCSGSSDYIAGRAFSFVMAVDAIGAWPPINESHVEMDAAWALYEAWVKLQTGEIDTALVYGFGKSSGSDLRRVLSLQLDPYYLAPLWPDSVSLAALQCRLGLDAGKWGEKDMAEVVARSRADARSNPNAQLSGDPTADDLLGEPYLADPLRRHDCAPITDGAAGVVLVAGERANEIRDTPAWITGFEHRIDAQNLGARDLTTAPSASSAAVAAGVDGASVAELHAPFSHQELILREAMGLGGEVRINPSGGPLCANPMFAAGLIRIGEAARRVWDGDAAKVVAHATSGPCLQQNLVCVMEAG